MLCLVGDAGRRASIARGAVSLMIGAAAGLTGMGASPGDVCARAGLAKGEAMKLDYVLVQIAAPPEWNGQ